MYYFQKILFKKPQRKSDFHSLWKWKLSKDLSIFRFYWKTDSVEITKPYIKDHNLLVNLGRRPYHIYKLRFGFQRYLSFYVVKICPLMPLMLILSLNWAMSSSSHLFSISYRLNQETGNWSSKKKIFFFQHGMGSNIFGMLQSTLSAYYSILMCSLIFSRHLIRSGVFDLLQSLGYFFFI